MADSKMTDGTSLEHHGGLPDELLLPTAGVLAAGDDPQLARARKLAGHPITPSRPESCFPRRGAETGGRREQCGVPVVSTLPLSLPAAPWVTDKPLTAGVKF